MSTDNFMKHFKVPKSEINRIKKEYSTAKEANEQITPEKLKCFEDMTKDVFDFFEEISGKKVNRGLMVAHVHYYFDEGFESEDLKGHVRKQISEPFFKENPERFTIAQLFPIRDQDRINMVWDHLSYYQGLRTSVNTELIGSMILTLKCGHPKLKALWMEKPCCEDCILEGNELEIMINPYVAIELLKDERLQELACFFMKQDADKTMQDYSDRTWERRSEIYGRYGVKYQKPGTLLEAV